MAPQGFSAQKEAPGRGLNPPAGGSFFRCPSSSAQPALVPGSIRTARTTPFTAADGQSVASMRPEAGGAAPPPPLRNGAAAHLLRQLPHTLTDRFECAHHLSPVVLVGERRGTQLQFLAHAVFVSRPPVAHLVDIPARIALAGLAQVPRLARARLVQLRLADERVALGTPAGLSFGIGQEFSWLALAAAALRNTPPPRGVVT